MLISLQAGLKKTLIMLGLGTDKVHDVYQRQWRSKSYKALNMSQNSLSMYIFEDASKLIVE